MNRMRVALVHKIALLSVAILLFCTPLQLAAQESPAADRISVIEWFDSLWGDLAAWLAGELAPTPPRPELPSESTGDDDNGCAIDPNGGCG